jgi:hypothetical protein
MKKSGYIVLALVMATFVVAFQLTSNVYAAGNPLQRSTQFGMVEGYATVCQAARRTTALAGAPGPGTLGGCARGQGRVYTVYPE